MKQNEIHSKLAENEARLKSEKKRLMMWSNLRLLSAFLVLVGMVYGFKNDFPLGFVLAGGALALFCYFVHCFNRQQGLIELVQNRLLVLERYDARAGGAS